MKKYLFIALVAVFGLTACSQGPTDVAKNFSEKLAQGKVDEAKKYATESTGKLLDMVSGFGGVKVQPNFKFEPIKDSIVDEKAWVFFKDENGDKQTVELVKVDGKWLVDVGGKK